MHRPICSIITLLVLVFLSPPAIGQIVSFEHVNVIPMHKDTILYDQRVIINGESIHSITPASATPNISVNHSIDARGKFLVPGLTDAHFHNETDITNEGALLIANGVTCVMNMAERPGQDQLSIRSSINSGNIIAPHYFTTGPYLQSAHMPTADEARRIVQVHRKRGYDFLKIADNLPPNIYQALIEEAKKQNVRVVGHAQRHLPLANTLQMPLLAHAEEFVYIFPDSLQGNDAFLQKVATEIKSSGIYISPTLSVFEMIGRFTNDSLYQLIKSDTALSYIPHVHLSSWLTERSIYRSHKWLRSDEGKKWTDEKLQWQLKFVKMLSQHGVPLLAGSDARGVDLHGAALSHELELMRAAGLTNYEVLKSATVTPAIFLHRDNAGTIAPRKVADLVLLDDNPLNDISNIKNVRGVMLKGKWMDRSTLDNMLLAVKKDAETSPPLIEIHPRQGIVLPGMPYTIHCLSDTQYLRYAIGSMPEKNSTDTMQSIITLTGAGNVGVRFISPNGLYDDSLRLSFTTGKAMRPVRLPARADSGALHYKYYPGRFSSIPQFSKLKPMQSGAINLNTDFETYKIPGDTSFSLLIDGFIKADKKGYYTFILDADEDGRLYIGGRLLINVSDSGSRTLPQSFMVPLEVGYYPVKIEFLQRSGGRRVRFSWWPPDGSLQNVPPELLWHDANKEEKHYTSPPQLF